MALGASAAHVQWRVVAKTLAFSSIGILMGLAGSLALSKLIASLLYGVSPTDPTTLLIMTLVLILVAAFAGFLPARRAPRTDPMSILRSA